MLSITPSGTATDVAARGAEKFKGVSHSGQFFGYLPT